MMSIKNLTIDPIHLILNAVRRHKQKYFCSPKYIRMHPDLYQKIMKENYDILRFDCMDSEYEDRKEIAGVPVELDVRYAGRAEIVTCEDVAELI